jgi:phosphoribosylformylglycinamidine synthase
LVLEDGPGGERAIDMPMDVLLGKPPKMRRDVKRVSGRPEPFNAPRVKLPEAAFAVLRHPTVASKRFLITIGDRTVGGMSSRDPMVGPWQVPVADCAITLADYSGFRGEAMSMGERTPLAVRRTRLRRAGWRWAKRSPTCWLRPSNCPASKLSCNWMAACGEPGEDAALYDTVRAVGMELCPALGISVPVGKDSSRCARAGTTTANRARSPRRSASSSAPSRRCRMFARRSRPLQPGSTSLILVDLGFGKNRMGGSMLAQVTNQFGGATPDLDDAGASEERW